MPRPRELYRCESVGPVHARKSQVKGHLPAISLLLRLLDLNKYLSCNRSELSQGQTGKWL